jgi:hypothetical protein
MSLILADRVRETTISSGTGTVSLSSVSGFQRFSAVCAINDVVPYFIVDGTAWEAGIGRYTAANTLTRETVIRSSNSDTILTLSGNTKDVALGMIADMAKSYYSKNLLTNSSFKVWQRMASTGAAAVSDGAMLADGWFGLESSGSAILKASYSAANSYMEVQQSVASSIRIGAGQCLWASDTYNLRGSKVTLAFDVAVNVATAPTIRAAVLEWTGTADSATRDVVNDWTSGTFTTGNFFKSTNFVLAGIGSVTIPLGSGGAFHTGYVTTSAITSSANNLIIFLWVQDTFGTLEAFRIKNPTLVRGSFPGMYTDQEEALERVCCLKRFCKTFPTGTTPANNAGFTGSLPGQTIVGSIDPEITWRFPVTMGKATPTITLYNPSSGTTGQWRGLAATLANARSYYTSENGTVIDNTDTAGASTETCFIHGTAEAEPCA